MTIASRRLENAQHLVKSLNAGARCVGTTVNVNNEQELGTLISQHDLVISLIPYTYHAVVIKLAIQYKKHVVTTSYINPQMAALHDDAVKAGITVMNEIGVDPGIDHLWAVKKIAEVHVAQGKILEFVSYCGGLPAPENSDNPLGYKFSWSSRGVLLALRNSAKFIEDGKVKEIKGEELMKSAKRIYTGYPGFSVVGYPNRDSSPYNERYSIPEAQTVIRGTLRYDGFPQFVQVLVNLGYLNDAEVEYLKDSPNSKPVSWRHVSAQLMGLKESDGDDAFLKALNEKGRLSELPEDERSHIVLGFKWLGLFSADVSVEKRGNVLDTLCALLEKKMQYGPTERDMVLLQHRFLVETKDKKRETHFSTLLEFGEPNGTTAMAKTVGVPCGIAVQLILDGKLNKKGVIAPMTMDICEPLITALEAENITMTDKILV